MNAEKKKKKKKEKELFNFISKKDECNIWRVFLFFTPITAKVPNPKHWDFCLKSH